MMTHDMRFPAMRPRPILGGAPGAFTSGNNRLGSVTNAANSITSESWTYSRR